MTSWPLLRNIAQIITVMLLLLGTRAAFSAPPVVPDVDAAGTSETKEFETHAIDRSFLLFPAAIQHERETQVGDYAEVNHNCCPRAGKKRGKKTKFEFSLDVTTASGLTAKLKGMVRTVYHEDPVSKRGFLGGFWAFLLDEKFGITDEQGKYDFIYDAYKSTFTATIVTGDSPAATWRLETEEEWKYNGPSALISGTLTNNERTLYIAGRPESAGASTFSAVYEEDELLSGRPREGVYEFRVGLDPELKLVLLAAMEAFAIDKIGEYRQQ